MNIYIFVSNRSRYGEKETMNYNCNARISKQLFICRVSV